MPAKKEKNSKEEKLSLEEKESFWGKVDNIYRHIKNVEEAAFLLARKLKDEGEIFLSLGLLKRARMHDVSKFEGIEWNCLSGDSELLTTAVNHHRSINDHHPEFHEDISDMSRLQIAEMVCDLKARSQETGTDLRDYIKNTFLPRYEITTRSKFYSNINYFVNLLLDKPMERIE